MAANEDRPSKRRRQQDQTARFPRFASGVDPIFLEKVRQASLKAKSKKNTTDREPETEKTPDPEGVGEALSQWFRQTMENGAFADGTARGSTTGATKANVGDVDFIDQFKCELAGTFQDALAICVEGSKAKAEYKKFVFAEEETSQHLSNIMKESQNLVTEREGVKEKIQKLQDELKSLEKGLQYRSTLKKKLLNTMTEWKQKKDNYLVNVAIKACLKFGKRQKQSIAGDLGVTNPSS